MNGVSVVSMRLIGSYKRKKYVSLTCYAYKKRKFIRKIWNSLRFNWVRFPPDNKIKMFCAKRKTNILLNSDGLFHAQTTTTISILLAIEIRIHTHTTRNQFTFDKKKIRFISDSLRPDVITQKEQQVELIFLLFSFCDLFIFL